MKLQPLTHSPKPAHLPAVAYECRWLDFWRVEDWKISGMVSVGQAGNTVELMVSIGHRREVYPLPDTIMVWKPAFAEFRPWTPPRKDVVDAINHCAWELWGDGQARYFRVVYEGDGAQNTRIYEGTPAVRRSYTTQRKVKAKKPATLVGYATRDQAKRATCDSLSSALYLEVLW